MAITFALPVGLENVDGSINVDETISTINLRADPYTIATYNGTLIDHGVYQFSNVASGEYKVYSNDDVLTIFGIIKVGEHNAVMITGNQTIAGVKTFSNQMVLSAGVQTDTISEKTSTSGVTIDGVLIKDSLDVSGIVAKTGAQSIAGLKTFTNDIETDYIYEDTTNAGVTFPDDPTTVGTLVLTQIGSNFSLGGYFGTGVPTPVTGSGIANKTYVDSMSIAPFQESPNVIRLIPGGSEKTGQVYTTYANAMQYALATAGVDHRMCIKIEGMGVAGYNYINMSDAGGAYVDDYIHFKGINQDILLIPPDTVTVGVTTLDNTIIENLTIYKDDIGVAIVFENLFFKDVSFNLTVLSATFTNCKFKNCDLKINNDGDTDATFTTCKGNFIASNQAVGAGVDANIKPKADF
jgi:hypothetical protein